MRISIRTRIAIAFGFISLASCTVHRPFQSDRSKAEYHLKQAAYHDPTLLDSSIVYITIEGKTLNFNFKPEPSLVTPPCILFSEPVTVYDTINNAEATLSQDVTTGEVNVTVTTPEEKKTFKCPETVQVFEGYSFWTVTWWCIGIAILSFALGYFYAK